MTVRGRQLLSVVAVMSWCAVLLELWLSIRVPLANGGTIAAGLVDYFSYFTVISNLFVAVISLLLLAGGNTPLARLGSGMVLGCATTAVLLAGVVYYFVLSDTWAPKGLQRISEVMQHYVVPSLAVAYWVLYPPREELPRWAPLAWCIYPLVYFGYVLARGEAMASYPYYFINVAKLGYGEVFTNGAALLGSFLLIGSAVYAVALLRHKARMRRPERREEAADSWSR